MFAQGCPRSPFDKEIRFNIPGLKARERAGSCYTALCLLKKKYPVPKITLCSVMSKAIVDAVDIAPVVVELTDQEVKRTFLEKCKE